MKDRSKYTVVLDFRVDGEKHTVDIDPEAPLLWVLCVDVGREAASARAAPQPPPTTARPSSARQAVVTS